MKKNKLWLAVVVNIGVFVLLSSVFMSCSDSTEPKTDDPPHAMTGNVTGIIRSSDGTVIENGMITIGEMSVTTNSAGEFLVSDVPAKQNVVVNISKEEFIPTHRTISVTQERTTHITARLFTAQISWNINPNTPNELSFSMNDEGAITLPENAFVDEQGAVFTGTVKATARHFDPTDPAQLESFPGTFSGIQTDGSEVTFESYGFISATFTAVDQRVGKLQLADGKKAGLKVPIPFSLQANAPETMPLWYFNETTGKWIEDGVAAVKVGDYYEGEVSHFSYWNFDYPIRIEEQSTIKGEVLVKNANNEDVPAANAEVVAMGVDYAGYTTAMTNISGEFSIDVKANAQVKLNARMGANTSPSTSTINTPNEGEVLELEDAITIGDMRFKITGALKDNTGESLAGKYMVLKESNPAAGSMPFEVYFNTDENGILEQTTVFGVPGNRIKLIVHSGGHGRNDSSKYYSNEITINAPYPGDTYDFGIITCYPGGAVKGRAVRSDGTPIANEGISISPEEQQSEEDFYWTYTDENGYFILSGQPGRIVRGLIGHIWFEDGSLVSNKFNVTFPSSGQTANIGNITFYQQD